MESNGWTEDRFQRLEKQNELQKRQIEFLFKYIIRKSHSAEWDALERDFPKEDDGTNT